MKAVFFLLTFLLGATLFEPVCAEDVRSQWLNSVTVQDVWNTKVFSAESTVDGIKYECQVYGEDYGAISKWESDKPFPISLDQMRKSAILAFRKRFPDFGDFSIAAIHVIHIKIIDRWLCEVEFNRIDQKGTVVSTIYLLILPNGKIITPK